MNLSNPRISRLPTVGYGGSTSSTRLVEYFLQVLFVGTVMTNTGVDLAWLTCIGDVERPVLRNRKFREQADQSLARDASFDAANPSAMSDHLDDLFPVTTQPKSRSQCSVKCSSTLSLEQENCRFELPGCVETNMK